jgi:acyl-CoA thioesterase
MDAEGGAAPTVRIERYPYRARAWWGDLQVAESDACLCAQSEGEPGVLYFPDGDIALHLFDRERVDSVEGGVPAPDVGVSRWSIAAAPPDGGGHQLLTTFSDRQELAHLNGYGTFDPSRVRLEVIDRRAGDDPRDVTVKRFPTWGDAAHLIDLLDVRPQGDGSFVGPARSDGQRPVVEGSQMLGQAIVAGARCVPEQRVVSAHMVFLRAADARRPLRFDVDERSRGRSFSALGVQVAQDGRCCATGTLLLGAVAPEVIRHAVEAPDVAGPYDSTPYDMGVSGRDIRVVDDAYTNDSGAPIGPPTLDAWVRFAEVPADPALHAGLLAQFTGHMSIAAALRPHEGVGQDQAHRTLSMGVNAITVTFHGDGRADEWMLYHHLSTFAGGGMTHSECRVHNQRGDLMASFTVEAMVRPFRPDAGAVDERTAL